MLIYIPCRYFITNIFNIFLKIYNKPYKWKHEP